MEGLEDLYSHQAKSSFDLLFSEPAEVKFEDIKFDFEIDPLHFERWLKWEHGNDPHSYYEYIDGDYAFNIGGECEFSCLYVAMLLHGLDLESEPVVYDGNFGFWEHYWIGYTWKGEEYFIDLTLRQFVKDAPMLAISKAKHQETAYRWYEDIERETISEYIERQRAFKFYLNPQNLEI